MNNNAEQDLINEYADLVILRDKLKKEAEELFRNYVRVFGDLMEEEFKLRIEIIKTKKSIAFCQRQKNFKSIINRTELNEFLENELSDYYDELNFIADIKNEKGSPLSEYETIMIKKIYKKIATMIHPDLNPKAFATEGIRELWEKAKTAYLLNNYDEIKDAEIAIIKILKQNFFNDLIFEIDDVNNKIIKIKEEINTIKNTDPYMYKYLLDNSDEIKDKKDELKEQIQGNQRYLDELQKILAEYDITEFVN